MTHTYTDTEKKRRENNRQMIKIVQSITNIYLMAYQKSRKMEKYFTDLRIFR